MLQENSQLRAFLDETCMQLRRFFGPESEFAVQRFEDPESSESLPTLFLLVKTKLEAEAASALLNRFDEEWWLDNASCGGGKIEVSLEFV